MNDGNAPVVLVTGAARRIGADIARHLHARGWRVVVHCRGSVDEAAALEAELEAVRPDACARVTADFSRSGAAAAAVREAAARWRRLDALVNNASSYLRTPLPDITPEQVEDLLASNLKAPLEATQAFSALPGARAVVNLIDVHARRVQPHFAPYFAAKSGLWTLTEALALELAPRVRVNGVAPGHILWAENSVLDDEARAGELARIPLQRLGQTDDIARAVAFLLSDDAAYITGAVLPVDGGLRLA